METTQELPVLVRDRLLAGRCISADVVTLSRNYLSIPLSDYVAAVEVQPMSNGGFRVIYREISEENLKWEFEWDRMATVSEETHVKTVAEVERILSRYVSDFSALVVGSNMYASA